MTLTYSRILTSANFAHNNCNISTYVLLSVMGCPKEKSTGLEGLFNFQVHEAEELR